MPATINNAREASEYLENTPRVWPYLFAIAHGRIGYGPGCAAYCRESGIAEWEFHLLHTAAVEKSKRLQHKVECREFPKAS